MHLITMASIRQEGKVGTLLVDKRHHEVYFTPQVLPEAKADKWLLWLLIVSGILVTPYWLFDRFVTLPHFVIHQPILWWLCLFLTAGLPFLAWYFGRQKGNYNLTQLKPLTVKKDELLVDLKHWWFERLWIAFVLFLLPPTSIMFFVFYVIKSDPLDALLITVHAALFLRRLKPNAISRIMITTKDILKWRQYESSSATRQTSSCSN